MNDDDDYYFYDDDYNDDGWWMMDDDEWWMMMMIMMMMMIQWLQNKFMDMTPFKESDHDDLYDHKTIITMNMRVWMKNVFHYNVYAAYRTQKTQDIMVKDDYFRMSYHSRTLPFLSYCVWKIFIYCGFGLISNLNRWNLKITSTCYQN